MVNKTNIADAAIKFHKAWIELVNFKHPKTFSSKMADALEARKAECDVHDKYDETFSQLTSICELYYRQKRMK